MGHIIMLMPAMEHVIFGYYYTFLAAFKSG